MELKEQKLTIATLRNYLDEWLFSTMSLKLLIDGRDDAFNFVIVNSSNGEVVYRTTYAKGEFVSEEETICSTSGIVNEEFRGVIEHSIMLDKQIASYKEAETNNKTQKGE